MLQFALVSCPILSLADGLSVAWIVSALRESISFVGTSGHAPLFSFSPSFPPASSTQFFPCSSIPKVPYSAQLAVQSYSSTSNSTQYSEEEALALAYYSGHAY